MLINLAINRLLSVKNDIFLMSKIDEEKHIIRISIEDFEKENIERRQHCGLIIASAFTMMILLLSFIKDRTIILDIGIFVLFLSILLQYELYRNIQPITETNGDINLYYQKYGKILRKYTFYDQFGYFAFFTGIAFLFVFFHLILFAYLLLAYLHYKWINLIIEQIKKLKSFKKKPSKYEVIDKDVMKTRKYYLVYCLIIGIILVVITITFVFNLF